MEQVIFKNPWQPFFAAHGLRCLTDFFAYGDGTLINQNTKRTVTVMTLPDGDRTRTFYMKRFYHPHVKDMLFTLGHVGKLCSQAELEWRNARLLLETGIETYHPVCYGYRTVCGIERQSFLVTEAIDGECLLDYLMQHWAEMAADDREALVVRLAEFLPPFTPPG
jgi:hypothetical protein